MKRSPYKRRIKLIQPRLQLRMMGAFLGLSVLCLLAQTLVLGTHLTTTASTMPTGGLYLAREIPGMLIESLLLSFLVLLPALLLIGIRITFKVAGPLYRFERHLREIRGGEWPEPCRIRKSDQLQEFCELMNAALESARAQGEAQGRQAEREERGAA